MAKAAITALEAAGWRIVGPEPTKEMVTAWREAFRDPNIELYQQLWDAIYAATPLHGDGK
jgi:hypothetical protein